jgi:hypothetical protein
VDAGKPLSELNGFSSQKQVSRPPVSLTPSHETRVDPCSLIPDPLFPVSLFPASFQEFAALPTINAASLLSMS